MHPCQAIRKKRRRHQALLRDIRVKLQAALDATTEGEELAECFHGLVLQALYLLRRR